MSERAVLVLVLLALTVVFVGSLLVADLAGLEAEPKPKIVGKCVVIQHRTVLLERPIRTERTC